MATEKFQFFGQVISPEKAFPIGKVACESEMQIVTEVSKQLGPDQVYSGRKCFKKNQSVSRSPLCFPNIKADINPTTCSLKVKVYYIKVITRTNVKLDTNPGTHGSTSNEFSNNIDESKNRKTEPVANRSGELYMQHNLQYD